MGQEKQPARNANVFISYSHNDQTFAQRLVIALKAAGHEVWIDRQNIPRAREWLPEIYEGIENADVFLTLVSQQSLLSEICNRETAYARECRKRLIPLIHQRINDEMEKEIVGEWFGQQWETVARQNWETIKQINWIFFDDDAQFDAEITSLLETLNQDVEFLKMHKRLLVRALEWDRHDRNPARLLRGTEITDAEAWLASAATQQPSATSTHIEYINASRDYEHAEQIKLQELQRKAISRLRYLLVVTLLAVAGIVAMLATVVVSQHALDQQNRQTLEALAENSYNSGNYEQARAYFTALIEQFDIPHVYLERGRTNQMLGLAEEAVADYTVFLLDNPDSADVYIYRGNAHTTLQEYDEALADYNRAVELDPDSAEAFRMRGRWQHIQGNFQQAIMGFSQAIALNEDFAEAYNDRGLTHFALGDLDEASNDFSLALQYERAFPDANVNLGRIEVQLEQYASARRYFREAILVQPNYAPAYYEIALLDAESEDISNAVLSYRFAMTFDSKYGYTKPYLEFASRLNICENLRTQTSMAQTSAEETTEPPPWSGTGPPPGGGPIHSVQPGENLFGISLRYGVSLSSLLAANPQLSDLIICYDQALNLLPTDMLLVIL